MPETKRKTSTPPSDYICSLCNVPGHWIQQCELKRKKRKKNENHIHVPGVDPSKQDIDRAREMQKIKPPKCFCGQPSRLKKVKKSSSGEDSRAIGKYFFFCNKAKFDETKCRFARPAEDEIKPKKERICTFFAKTGFCKKGDKCMFSHNVEVKGKKKPEKKEQKSIVNLEAVKNSDNSSSCSSSSSSSLSSSSSSLSTSSSSSSSDSSVEEAKVEVEEKMETEEKVEQKINEAGKNGNNSSKDSDNSSDSSSSSSSDSSDSDSD